MLYIYHHSVKCLLHFNRLENLGEEISLVLSAWDLDELMESPVPQQVNPTSSEVNVLHLAHSACVLSETLGCCGVDQDLYFIRDWEISFLADKLDMLSKLASIMSSPTWIPATLALT